MVEIMLTTVDNPFDPFEQFIPWFMFDIEKGYNTCGKLARLTELSDDMSEVEIERATDDAIHRLIAIDDANIFTVATRSLDSKDTGPTD